MFTEKLNKREIPYVIEDEILKLDNGKGEVYLAHDNVRIDALEIWTEPKKAGRRVMTYVLDTSSYAPWSTFIRVFGEMEQVFITYETYGDQVEAMDINVLQNGIENLRTQLNMHKADLKCHIENGVPITVRRGTEEELKNIALAVGEMGFALDSYRLYIGTSSGNLLLSAGTLGDMSKAVYDPDNDGIVEKAKTAEAAQNAENAKNASALQGHSFSEFMPLGPITWGQLKEK